MGPQHQQPTWYVVPAGLALHEGVIDALHIRFNCPPLHASHSTFEGSTAAYRLSSVKNGSTFRCKEKHRRVLIRV